MNGGLDVSKVREDISNAAAKSGGFSGRVSVILEVVEPKAFKLTVRRDSCLPEVVSDILPLLKRPSTSENFKRGNYNC